MTVTVNYWRRNLHLFRFIYRAGKNGKFKTALFEELRYIVGLTDEDIEHFKKERRRGTRYTPILLKPSLTEEQIARFAVNQYKYPSLDVRPYFKRNYLYGEA